MVDKKEQVLGVIRHTLTFLGGVLVTRGVIDESTLAELSGAVVTLIGVVWSVINHSKI